MATPALNPLVEKIRGKYPGAYDDMDDAALTKAILAKYPQYSDLAAPGVQKPQVKMDSGEGPIAAGLTSMESQLSQMPKSMWLSSPAGWFTKEGTERLKARELEGAKAQKQGTVAELKQAVSPLNPVVKTDAGTPAERMDWGATAANLLPYAIAGRGAIEDVPASKVTAPVRAAVKGANKVLQNYPKTVGAAAGGALGSLTHVPLARELGAGIGAGIGSEVLPKVSLPGEGFGLPNRITGGPAEAPKFIPPSKVSSTPPESVSKSSQLQQAKALQNIPASAAQNKPAILQRLQQIAQQPGTGVSAPETSGPSLQIAGKPVPANVDLTAGLQIPQARVEGKIMQVLRREGLNSTIGMDKLMEAKELKGISREQVQAAATSLRDSGKVWGHEARGAGEEAPSIYGIALRKR